MTETAPSGATIVAGAYAYARKLPSFRGWGLGLGFRVYSLGFRGRCSGFRVWVLGCGFFLGFGDEEFGFRVWGEGVGFRVWGLGPGVED